MIVGTSGVVLLAAAFPRDAHTNGARLIGIGPEPGLADIWLRGAAGEVLPALLAAIEPDHASPRT